MVALAVTSLCVKKFLREEKPPTAGDICRELEVPIRLVRSVLSELTEARILSEIGLDRDEDVAYQPACDVHCLSVASVMERLDQQGVATVPIAESADVEKLRETIKRFREINDQSTANLKLQDL
jgi:membrane protein